MLAFLGFGNSKIDVISIPLLIRQLNDLNLPEDRHRALDTLEQIDHHLLEPKTLALKCQQLKDSDGIYVVLKTSKKLVEDVDCISTLTQIVESIKDNIPLMMDFIQYGGLDLVEKALRLHARDDFLAVTLPHLLKVITAVGAAVSIQEIQNEGLNLKLCVKCQEVIQRDKLPLGSIQKIVIPKSADRANRVLRFMDNYLERVDVQIAGLDAMLNFCRNADAIGAAKETDILEVLTRCLKQHITELRVVWRACLALSLLASLGGEIAVNLVNLGVHALLVPHFHAAYAADPLVQQQVLWLFAAFLKWPRSMLALHKSEACMAFLASLLAPPAATPEEVADGTAAVQPNAMQIALPVQIRSFLRQTKGVVFVEPSKKGKAQVFKERRNFDEKPRFGTTANIFTKGESGLLPGLHDDDAGNDTSAMPEWEQRLNFNELQSKR